jgi:hypothetical protein
MRKLKFFAYIFTATGKRFIFSQQTQVLNINEDTDNVNFIANDLSRFGND